MDSVRRRQLHYWAPDGKCQVGVVFRDHAPLRIHSVTLVTSQHSEQPTPEQPYDDLLMHVIQPVFADEAFRLDAQTRVTINPEGPTIEGGPALHAGLTGRKNSDDTHGGFSRHGGAALSGKDPTRIDRVGADAARHAAKNIVAAGLAGRWEVQLSYSIGMAQPVSIHVETFGTGNLSVDQITERVASLFDFQGGSIIRHFALRSLPQLHQGRFYRTLAAYSHLGRTDLELPWEATDVADALR